MGSDDSLKWEHRWFAGHVGDLVPQMSTSEPVAQDAFFQTFEQDPEDWLIKIPQTV